MPGSTPRHGFPYPIDIDQIDVAGDIQGLAEAIDGYHYPAESGPRDTVPTHGRFGHYDASGDRGFMAAPDGVLAINAGSQFAAYVDNGVFMVAIPGSVSFYGSASGLTVSDHVQSDKAIVSAYNPVTDAWSNGHFVGYSNSRSARMVLNGFGAIGQIACQMRVNGVSGQQLDCVNSDSTSFSALGASAFNVNSALDSKRDVQTLSDDIARSTPSLDPASDTVAQPDILGLRPVTYRPAVGVTRIVPAGDEINIDPGDPATWTTEPIPGVVGAEGDRERLGLVAEEVATVLPSAVTHDADGNAIGIDYAQVTVALLDHVQRLTARLEALEGATP